MVKEVDLSRMPLSVQELARREIPVLRSLGHPNVIQYLHSPLPPQPPPQLLPHPYVLGPHGFDYEGGGGGVTSCQICYRR